MALSRGAGQGNGQGNGQGDGQQKSSRPLFLKGAAFAQPTGLRRNRQVAHFVANGVIC